MVDQPRQADVKEEQTVMFMGAEVPLSKLPLFCRIEGPLGISLLLCGGNLAIVTQSIPGNSDDAIFMNHGTLQEFEQRIFDREDPAIDEVIDEAEFERFIMRIQELGGEQSPNPRVSLILRNSSYDDYRGPFSHVKKPLMFHRPFIHPSLWEYGSERWMCSSMMALGKTEWMAVEHHCTIAIQFEQPRRLFEKAVQSLPFDWKIRTSWQRTQAVLRSNGLIPMSFAKPGRPQVRASELHNLRSARGKAATGPSRRNRDNQLATRQPTSHRVLNRLRKSFNAQIKARQETSRAARTFKAVLNAAKA